MGEKAFDDLLAGIQSQIDIMDAIADADILEKWVTVLRARLDSDGPTAEQAAGDPQKTQSELTKA